ncbi:hypothetical protein, partial [Kitasatospora sp. NPDC085879]|uniref:hypothetical protein n=1 Tax=Kitasatospora sp. NPDC085879 TaxID=3154769 RepID=UPI00342B88DB
APNGQLLAGPEGTLYVPEGNQVAGSGGRGQWLHFTPPTEPVTPHTAAPAAERADAAPSLRSVGSVESWHTAPEHVDGDMGAESAAASAHAVNSRHAVTETSARASDHTQLGRSATVSPDSPARQNTEGAGHTRPHGPAASMAHPAAVPLSVDDRAPSGRVQAAPTAAGVVLGNATEHHPAHHSPWQDRRMAQPDAVLKEIQAALNPQGSAEIAHTEPSRFETERPTAGEVVEAETRLPVAEQPVPRLTTGIPGQLGVQGVGGYASQVAMSLAGALVNIDWTGLAAGAMGTFTGHARLRHSFWGSCHYDKAAASPITGVINPFSLKYMQDSIGKASGDGHNVFKTARDLKKGDLTPDDLPAVRVVQLPEGRWTLDHRRVVSFQMAGVTEIPHRLVDAGDEAVKREIARKMTTTTDGLSIEIRGTGGTVWTNPHPEAVIGNTAPTMPDLVVPPEPPTSQLPIGLKCVPVDRPLRRSPPTSSGIPGEWRGFGE